MQELLYIESLHLLCDDGIFNHICSSCVCCLYVKYTLVSQLK